MSALGGARKGLIFGVVAAGWVVLWSRALDWASKGIFPPSLREAPENPLREGGLLEAVLTRTVGVDWSSGRGGLLLVSWLLLSMLAGSVWSSLRLDREHFARQAFCWALRRTALPAIGIAGGIFVCLAVGMLWSGESFGESLLAVPLLLSLAALVGIPLAVMRPEFASGADPRWWRPRWPGSGVILGVIAVLAVLRLVELGLDVLVERVPAAGPVLLLPSLALWLLGVALTAHLLVERLTLPQVGERLRRILRERGTAGPWLTLLAAFGLALVLAAVPVAFAYLWIWKAVPVAAQLAAGHGVELPSAAKWTVTTLNVVGRFGSPGLVVPIALLLDASRARLVHLLVEDRRGMLAPSTTSAAEEPGGALSPEGRL